MSFQKFAIYTAKFACEAQPNWRYYLIIYLQELRKLRKTSTRTVCVNKSQHKSNYRVSQLAWSLILSNNDYHIHTYKHTYTYIHTHTHTQKENILQYKKYCKQLLIIRLLIKRTSGVRPSHILSKAEKL